MLTFFWGFWLQYVLKDGLSGLPFETLQRWLQAVRRLAWRTFSTGHCLRAEKLSQENWCTVMLDDYFYNILKVIERVQSILNYFYTFLNNEYALFKKNYSQSFFLFVIFVFSTLNSCWIKFNSEAEKFQKFIVSFYEPFSLLPGFKHRLFSKG